MPVSRAARAHSEDMLERGYLGHLAPSGESPHARARRAGVDAARLLENVSVAPDLARAHAALLDSPGHRRNVLDPEVTHVGLGVARGLQSERPVLYLTQVFAKLVE